MRLKALTSAGCTVAMTAAVLAGVPALPAVAAPTHRAPKVQQLKPVPVRAAPRASAAAGDDAAAHRLRAVPAVSWPAPGTARVAIPSPPATTAGSPPRPAVRAGRLPVWIGAARSGGPKSAQANASAPAASMNVQVLPHDTAVAAGLAGMMFKLHRTDAAAAVPATVSVHYSSFRNAYGGDWAQRLQIVKLPACAATTPSVASCRSGTALASTNDVPDGQVSAQVSATGTDALFAVAASPSGDAGTYTATALTDSGTWQVSTQAGEFSWSYPMITPSVPGGLEPTVTALYSSSSVDGQTATTNNQPSWVGEGWSLDVGSIQRGYEACVDVFGKTSANGTGDECWGPDNATMLLNGQSTPLVKVNNTTWVPQNDNGETVSHLTGGTNGDDNGEYWVVTTTDGTRYYFGLNRLPGWASTDPTTQSVYTVPVFGSDPENPSTAAFADSARTQAYQWNLDYVVDAHGDAIAYYYAPETNAYGELLGKKVGTYVRGGTLARIEYGLREPNAYSPVAPARVMFGTADRCVVTGTACSTHTAANWPDVPFDQACATSATSCGTKVSPTFWSTKRLATVTTQVRNGTAYTAVDQWKFSQSYPDPGDGSGDGLWLNSIQHIGLVGGTASTPPVVFHGITFPNRVNTPGDGIVPMDKYRIISIDNESGGVLDVHYATPDCDPASFPAPASNTTRCFPQIWTPPGDSAPRTDWFTKYVVAQISQEDQVGGNPDEVMTYNYPPGGGAWHYTDNQLIPASRRTWSTWRGFQSVRVVKGDPTKTDQNADLSEVDYTYYRGMDGDKQATGTRTVSVSDSQGVTHPDSNQFAGMRLEEVVRDGVDGPVVTDEITTPWQRGPTATQGSLSAFMVETGRDVTRTALAAGGFRATQIDSTFNTNDLPSQISDLGDTSTSVDDRCTITSYAGSATANLVDLPADVVTVGTTCGTTPSFPADAISDEKKTYDAAGDALTTAEVTAYSGVTPQYVTTDTSTYDMYGRVTSRTDALGHRTTTHYGAVVAASPAPTRETDVTDALGTTTTTINSVAFDQPVKSIDGAGNTATLTYDPFGRLAQVWDPTRPLTSSPSQKFGYSVSTTAASWQSTSTLDANGNYQTSYTLYDGFLRQRQTQAPQHNNTTTSSAIWRNITDTFYDSQGQVTRENAPYINDSAPSGTLVVSTVAAGIPHARLTKYDGAGRPVMVTEVENGVAATDAAGNPWKTVTVYGGDHIDVTPPVGTTPTSTYTDARGQTTQIRQYHGTSPTGAFDTTAYTYTRAGKLATMTDAAGDTWTYGYDVRGNQTSVFDPDKGASTSTYDEDDNRLSITDARGQTLAYTYDALNRKTGEYDGGAANATLLSSWTYDPLLGYTSSANSFADGNKYSTTIDAVDADARPTKQSVVIPPNETGLSGTYSTTTTYKPDGSPNTVTLPAMGTLPAETLIYAYDYLGSAKSMVGLGDYVTNTLYGQNNDLGQIQFGPDTAQAWETITHDLFTDRLTSIGVQTLNTTGNVDTQQYSYDLSGNVTSEADSMPGQAIDRQCFNYDYLQRMTQSWTTTAASCGLAGSSLGGPAPYWQSYTYDLLGDRSSQIVHATTASGTDLTRTYHYADAAHPQAVSGVTSTGPTGSTISSYTYNATGDTTSRPAPDGGTQTLTWNPDDLTSQITEGTSTVSYTYDAAGDRLISRDATGVTLYLPNGEVHVNPAGTGAVATRFYSYSGQNVAERVGRTVTYLVGDDQGTTTLQIDASTLAVTKRRFDPFGDPRNGAAFAGDRGFLDGVNDTAVGLLHLGSRDYDPSLGRFVSVDPILGTNDPATINPYAYAQDNPATLSDPTGNFTGCISDGNGCVPNSTLPPELTRHYKYAYVPAHDRYGDIDLRGPRWHRVVVSKDDVATPNDNSHLKPRKPKSSGGGLGALLKRGLHAVGHGLARAGHFVKSHPVVVAGLLAGATILSFGALGGFAALGEGALLADATVAGGETIASTAVDAGAAMRVAVSAYDATAAVVTAGAGMVVVGAAANLPKSPYEGTEKIARKVGMRETQEEYDKLHPFKETAPPSAIANLLKLIHNIDDVVRGN